LGERKGIAMSIAVAVVALAAGIGIVATRPGFSFGVC
jgi:hypothetical protein